MEVYLPGSCLEVGPGYLESNKRQNQDEGSLLLLRLKAWPILPLETTIRMHFYTDWRHLATFLTEKACYVDHFYDTPDFQLARGGLWLKLRLSDENEDAWSLKIIPQAQNTETADWVYFSKETNEAKIVSLLNSFLHKSHKHIVEFDDLDVWTSIPFLRYSKDSLTMDVAKLKEHYYIVASTDVDTLYKPVIDSSWNIQFDAVLPPSKVIAYAHENSTKLLEDLKPKTHDPILIANSFDLPVPVDRLMRFMEPQKVDLTATLFGDGNKSQ